ncbi:site-specific DNA-methyltransferase [Shewanella sp. SM96]|uniref:site-specific DNA-methyltransferase n=1 Tax=Shewanella sp. SM96 TaxID=2912813 RepID=UPI0021D89CA3|nr:site-specific DNA-methyltransferase [Shewanella sp. SM96]MCU8005880.1 site-specific DNA-methyltransferase [Shewanella sp. SM96]
MPTLDFKGKQFVYSHHLSVPFRELKVVADKSLPQEGKLASLDDNLIIHGDNLEALKALLPTHAGKVDCIFIDPPYNTGNEGWCYNDNVRSPLMQEWLKKSANPVDKEDLERHDKWLCMMWPRLMLLKELLSNDGSIWVTLDDNEVNSAKLLMDEVFGDDKFVGLFVVVNNLKGRNDKEHIAITHEYILVYSGDEFVSKGLDLTEDQLKDFTLKDESGSLYSLRDLRKRGSEDRREDRPKMFYPIFWNKTANTLSLERSSHTDIEILPMRGDGTHGRWRWGKTRAFQNLKNLEAKESSKGRFDVSYRVYLDDTDGKKSKSFWHGTEFATDLGTTLLKNIFAGQNPLGHAPKTLAHVQRCIDLSIGSEGIVLDSFAGSGTTAHAVLEANKKDSGNRKFILVECEDYADTLTAERVRRVINGYRFKGNQKQELLSEKITWSVFEKKHAELLEKIAKVEAKYSCEFDKIKKELKDGVLTVTGERKVDEFAQGIGGSFTYCTLGEPIQIESLLTGKEMPSFDALARYVFYTATGQSLENVAKASADGFIGETDLFRIHLFYRPDSEWLRSNEAALNADKVEAIAKNNVTKKRTIVFAVAKFISQKNLTEKHIDFCQLPYAIHRIMGA